MNGKEIPTEILLNECSFTNLEKDSIVEKKNEHRQSFSTAKIYRNLLILSFSFLILLTGHNGIISLQTTLNAKDNIGVNALLIMNIFIIV